MGGFFHIARKLEVDLKLPNVQGCSWSAEQPIMSKHRHALLRVPPIYRDVTENAGGSNKHRSLRVVEPASQNVSGPTTPPPL